MAENSKSEGFKGEKAIVTPYVIREMQAENPITRQLYVTHIGYYPTARFHYRERVAGTHENILIYCERGQGWIEHAGMRVSMQECQYFILPADQYHAYGADEKNPWSIYWLHFKGERCNMFESILGKVLTIPVMESSRQNDRIRVFEDMFKNLAMGYSHENLEYITFCLQYFLASLKYISQYDLSTKAQNGDAVQRCIHFMKDNLEKKMTLAELANEVGYSSSHFNALFVKGTSFSPMEYFNQLKIQRVCYYLQFSDLKIKEIAFKLGFYDPFHLSKAFMKEMGISPKTYKAKYSVVVKP